MKYCQHDVVKSNRIISVSFLSVFFSLHASLSSLVTPWLQTIVHRVYQSIKNHVPLAVHVYSEKI